MAEVLPAPSATPNASTAAPATIRASTSSPAPQPRPSSPSADSASSTLPPPPRSLGRKDDDIAPQNSRSSSHLSTHAPTAGLEYPAFASTLSYALVRDFAYPAFHVLHYGAILEPSRPSTPISEWNVDRRHSDPMDARNHVPTSQGRWSAGPWGGDGGVYDDPEEDAGLVALPSTSFDSADEHGASQLEYDEEEGAFKMGKHRKSKSYSDMTGFERGRRRESARRSRGDASDTDIFWFQGQQPDLLRAQGYSSARGDPNGGGRKDSPFSSTTLPNRSFQSSGNNSGDGTANEDDEQIPLDSEPRISPQRDSIGPEDEELFAGPSLALYSFEPENSNELRLHEGQEIMVSYRHGQGWLVASDPLTGEQGLVPEAYVRLIADMPNYDPEKGEFVDLDEYDEEEREEESLDNVQRAGAEQRSAEDEDHGPAGTHGSRNRGKEDLELGTGREGHADDERGTGRGMSEGPAHTNQEAE